MDVLLMLGLLVVSAVVVATVLRLEARNVRSLRWWSIVIAVGGLATPLAFLFHNVFSGVIDGEEAISFIVAIFIAPPCLIVGLSGASIVLLGAGDRLWIPVGLTAAGAVYYLMVVLTPLPAPDKTAQFLTAAAIASAGAAGTLALYLGRRLPQYRDQGS